MSMIFSIVGQNFKTNGNMNIYTLQ